MPAPFLPEPLSGVYVIICPRESKGYIGQSKDVGLRWTVELNQLLQGLHHNEELQKDFSKHGLSAFMFRMLRTVVDPDDRRQVEHEMIQLALGSGRQLYNKLLDKDNGEDWIAKEGITQGVKSEKDADTDNNPSSLDALDN